MDKPISTIGELIDALDGPKKAAEALGATSPQQVVNWRRRGKITPGFYMQHQAALLRRGLAVSPSLWFGDAS